MGADLFISELFDAQVATWQGLFNEAIAERDKAKHDSEEYCKLQRRVWRYFRLMWSEGYFRDTYDDSSLLRKFQLSWSIDIAPRLDSDDCLSVEKTKEFLVELERLEDIFNHSLVDMTARERRYFRRKYQRLSGFLNQAVSLNLPIVCSL